MPITSPITIDYKMATEEVLDDSKNESGIPRAVFVVRNLCHVPKTASSIVTWTFV